MTIIEAKLEGQEVATPEAAPPPASRPRRPARRPRPAPPTTAPRGERPPSPPTVDLMAALRASVEAAKARKEAEAGAADNGATAEKAAVAAD